MSEYGFPLLSAEDIECRISQIATTTKGTYASLLLYKNARVDMRILDEVCGPMNWQREHEYVAGNLFCTIFLWDCDKCTWIKKQDVGVESNVEKEKGQASDAFKRAATNVGIGRELYTAPKRIKVMLTEDEFKTDNGKTKVKPWVQFDVKEIEYGTRRDIIGLVIEDGNGKERFRWKKA